jgi:hypothetical protein
MGPNIIAVVALLQIIEVVVKLTAFVQMLLARQKRVLKIENRKTIIFIFLGLSTLVFSG